MQRLQRDLEPPPQVLRSPAADQSRRRMRDFMLSAQDKRQQTSVPRSDLPLADTSLRDGLRRVFRNRCAFCEALDEIQPHRFRPEGEALPYQSQEEGHLYYAWLADAWENLYAICSSCRPQEPNYFPVEGKRSPLPVKDDLDRYVEEGTGSWRQPIDERPLLLDPCRDDDFHRALHPRIDGVLEGLTKRGVVTIEHFRLNAPARVDARREVYAERRRFLKDALRTGLAADVMRETLFDFPALAFGGTWYILLRRLALRLWPASAMVLSPARIARAYMTLHGDPRSDAMVEAAVQALVAEDAAPRRLQPAAPARPSQARLASVEIRNFKALEALDISMPEPPASASAEQAGRAPALVILGENAAGKSTILEAIALTLCDEAARRKLRLPHTDYILLPSLMGDDRAHAARTAQVRLLLSDQGEKTLTVSQEGFTEGGAGFTSGPVPVFAYGAFRQYQRGQRLFSPERHVQNLFTGNPLSNPERWLLGLDDQAYAMVVRALREILSIQGDFEVLQRKEGRCSIVTAAGTPTPLAAVSSGFRSVLAMACDIMAGLMDRRVYADFEAITSARGVVLIDEVEAHLHPRWKMQIMRGLRRAMPQMTFIATTHDPLCLRGMENGEVVVLQRIATAESSASTDLPVVVEKLLHLPDVSRLRVEQLLTSDFFQLFSSDAADTEHRIADVADLLVRQQRGESLAASEEAALASFRQDIGCALPVGTSEAHRLVQEAVAAYLQKRRQAGAERLQTLRSRTRSRIIRILGM